MATTQDILLTYKTDTGEVTKSLEEIVSGLEGVDNKIEETAEQTSKVGKGLRAAGKLGATGFKALGTAIAATGIGLLIGLIAGLTAKMAENKKIAEAFEVVVSAVGAAFNILVQKIEPFAGLVIDAFSNPVESIQKLGDAIKQNIQNRIDGVLTFIPKIGQAWDLLTSGKWKEASKVAADAVGQVVLGVTDITDKIGDAADAVGEFATEYADEVGKATQSATKLTQEQQKLRDQQRDLNVEYAQARAEIEQLKLKRDDERLSIEKRIEAAQRGAELDQEFADKREAIANREVALVQREIAIQGDSIERQDELAEAHIAAAEAAESSAAVQTEFMTSIIGLQNEQIANQEELNALTEEQIDDVISRQDQIDEIVEAGQNREIQKVKDKYIALQEEARLNNQILVGAEEAQRIELEAINSKYDDIDKANAKAVLDSRVQFATQALGALSALNDAFSGDSEKQQKKAFQRNKAIGISTAIINTAGAIIGAINPASGGLGIPAGLPGAAIAAATGVAQIATIAKSRFKSAGSPPPAPSGGGGGAAGLPTPTAPQLDLSFLGAGAGQDGFRTYVIASEVSNSQQANQKINDQAALVG